MSLNIESRREPRPVFRALAGCEACDDIQEVPPSIDVSKLSESVYERLMDGSDGVGMSVKNMTEHIVKLTVEALRIDGQLS